MGLIIDTSLPAAIRLSQSGYLVEPPSVGRPDACIALVNLMPVKPDTEYDFMQLIAPLDTRIEIKLVRMSTHRSRHTAPGHIDRYYSTFGDVAGMIDGIIVTGAPLDHIPFEDVTYWEEMKEIFRFIRRNSIPALYVCWGAFASLYFWHGISMHAIDRKISGVFAHEIYSPDSPLMNKVKTGFYVPHSRYVVWDKADIDSVSDLDIVAGGEPQGIYIVASKSHPEYYLIGHGEYAVDTLDKEYNRDIAKGINPHIPTNYYPGDDPSALPIDRWRDTAVTIMGNWIEEVIKIKKNKSYD